MGGISVTHWLIVAVVVMLLFGKGRFSGLMGDVAKGLKSFKKELSDDDQDGAAHGRSALGLQMQTAFDANPDLRKAPDDRSAH